MKELSIPFESNLDDGLIVTVLPYLEKQNSRLKASTMFGEETKYSVDQDEILVKDEDLYMEEKQSNVEYEPKSDKPRMKEIIVIIVT